MNKRWLIISLTGLILLSLIAACAQSAATLVVETLNDDQAKALIAEKCSACHSTDRVFQADYDEEGWANVIDNMVDKGADVSPEEKDQMVEWLAARDQ